MEIGPLFEESKDPGAVFTVSRFLGLICVNKTGELTTPLVVVSFLILSVSSAASVAAMLYSLLEHIDTNDQTDNFWSATEIIRCSLDIVAVFTHFTSILVNRTKFRRSYVRVSRLRVYKSKSVELKIVVGMFAFRTCCSLFQIHIAEQRDQIVDVISGHLTAFMYFNTTLIVLQMCTMTEAIRSKFDEFLKISPQHYLLTDRHSKTVDFLVEVLSIYEGTLLIFALRSLIEMTSMGFYSYVTFYKVVNDHSMWYSAYSAVNLISLVVVLTTMFIVVRTCEMASEQIECFHKELFRQMRGNPSLCTNKKLSLYVSMRKTITFTACGFFTLGYPLITSIVAAATTYLVILVQFSVPKT
uniref:Gustatory receptor n=1 Tax=Cyrtorhinus lividipennis TaxID=1032904 RepID=A0A346TI31_9HEMI|nr:gustatory receptor 2 [Cyrtorhinus lividipennis]